MNHTQPCLTQWNYKPCHVGPPKTDRSQWRVLTKCGPLEKGMANHFNILTLRTPRAVWKGENIWHWKIKLPMSVGAQYVFESHSCCWCEELTHWKRPWCWGRLRAGEGEERMRWLDGIPDQGHKYGDGQGGLACCSSCKESDMTERLKWTELMRMWRIGNPNTLLVGK